MQMAVYEDGSQGKHAVTHYKVLERFKYMTGGMSTTIDFEAVVSNSASTASGVEEPLGSLAGRGFNQGST